MRKRQEEMEVHIEFPTYSERELDDFDKWLDQFRVEREIELDGKKKTIRPIDMNEAAVGAGAMRKRGAGKTATYAILVTPIETDAYGKPKRYAFPTAYDLFNHKYEALSKLKERRSYAKEKQMEYYEQQAAISPAKTEEPPAEYNENF